jgi:hypothetical protein
MKNLKTCFDASADRNEIDLFFLRRMLSPRDF